MRICTTFIPLLTLALFAGCQSAKPTPQAASLAGLQADYRDLLNDIEAYNPSSPEGPTSFVVNTERLFVFEMPSPQSVRSRAIWFSRRPGGLDLLFSRLLDPKTDPDEVLAVAEMLVYFGEPWPDDFSITSSKADAVIKAVDAGRLAAAEKKFPDALIKGFVIAAAKKAEANAVALSK